MRRSDWSSDVCSSVLRARRRVGVSYRARQRRAASLQPLPQMGTGILALGLLELLATHGEPATHAVELPQADPGDRLRQLRYWGSYAGRRLSRQACRAPIAQEDLPPSPRFPPDPAGAPPH